MILTSPSVNPRTSSARVWIVAGSPSNTGMAILSSSRTVSGSQDLVVVTLGKDDLLGLCLRFVDHHARDFVRFAQPALQLFAVDGQVDRLLRDSGLHGRLCNSEASQTSTRGSNGFGMT